MDTERPPNLRSPGTDSGPATTPLGGGIGGGAPPINALAELVADLIAATGLVPADKLAVVRSAAGMGSFAHALVEQNVARALDLADHAWLLETGSTVMSGTAQALRDDAQIRRSYLGF